MSRPDQTTRDGRLETALRDSITAIDDWLNIFAEDVCDAARVAEARQRLRAAGGTLSYIAGVQERNREALANG